MSDWRLEIFLTVKYVYRRESKVEAASLYDSHNLLLRFALIRKQELKCKAMPSLDMAFFVIQLVA